MGKSNIAQWGVSGGQRGLPRLPLTVVLDETVLFVHIVYLLFIVENGCIPLTQMDQRLNTFDRKECLGREAYWLNSQGQPI